MKLFEPFTLGRTQLANHMVMAPMTRSRAVGNVPNALMRDYYLQRASAGMIVTEGIAPSPNGLGYSRIPGLFSQEQVDGWREVTDGVHAAGGRIFAQLMHTGRIGHPLNMPAGARIVAPSAVQAMSPMWTDQQQMQPMPMPEEMSAADVKDTIREIAQSATNAIAAGFDGVELHGANGYLLEQFLHPHSNRRTDAYGGSADNRGRFVREVASACSDAIGADRVGIRLSPFGTNGDLPVHSEVVAQYGALAQALNGLIYVHLVRSRHSDYPEAEAAIRSAYSGTLILNGNFNRDTGEAALQEHKADLVAFGRPFIGNPNLVERFKNNLPMVEANPQTFFSPGAQGYTDY